MRSSEHVRTVTGPATSAFHATGEGRHRRVQSGRPNVACRVPGFETQPFHPYFQPATAEVPGFGPQRYRDFEHTRGLARVGEQYRDSGHKEPGSRTYGYRDCRHDGTGISGTTPAAHTGIPGITSGPNCWPPHRNSSSNSVLLNSSKNSPTGDVALFGGGEGK